MSASIKADGDTWRVELGDEGPGGPRVVMFYCTSTDQRPYRVTELSPDQIPDGLEARSATELQKLFDASRSMGSPRGYPTYRS